MVSPFTFPLPKAPLVNGRPTKLVRVDRQDLDTSIYLAPFADMVNASFMSSYYQPVMSPQTQRLESHQQLLYELKPGIMIFLLVPLDDPSTVLASVCAEPFVSPTPEMLAQVPPEGRVWIPDPVAHNLLEPRWVLKLLCVAPEAQHNGLGKWLMATIDDAVRHRVKEQRADSDDERVAEECATARLVLSTIKDINGRLYEKWGWATTSERKIEAGFLGSEGGFTLVFMDRVIEL
ncbi:hypothetical protein BKA62DRAFT_756283, partial [Auriculariales sp. MPI-PUGE-AT-0066]